MSQSSIYGTHLADLESVRWFLLREIEKYGQAYSNKHGEKLYDHVTSRIKSEESMREKLSRKELEETTENALWQITDAIGIRIVSKFIDEVYLNVANIKNIPGIRVVQEKDYIRQSKPNGYRSYHMILEIQQPEGNLSQDWQGSYYVEIQLRTIAMDTWAALEHELKYKKELPEPELIADELHRCANELAACDVSMQALRDLIQK